MEEATQAFVFFWLAGLFVLSGGMLGFFSKVAVQRKAGLAMASAGLLSLMATPWTLPFSPSSAFGHLLGSLVGPSVLLGVGFYLITFSGNVPVGQLSRADRNTGVVMVLTGVLWLEAMHWWELTPTYPGEVNRYWLIFWPTMLLGVLAFGAGAAALEGLPPADPFAGINQQHAVLRPEHGHARRVSSLARRAAGLVGCPAASASNE